MSTQQYIGLRSLMQRQNNTTLLKIWVDNMAAYHHKSYGQWSDESEHDLVVATIEVVEGEFKNRNIKPNFVNGGWEWVVDKLPQNGFQAGLPF